MKQSAKLETESPSIQKRATIFCVALIAMLCASFAWTLTRGGTINDPPAPWNVDGIFYDNIAFNMNEGEGFVVNLNAQPWRDSYLQYGSKGNRIDLNYGWLTDVKGTGPTALRSPAYPCALSAIFRCFGHRYWAARVFGCVSVSIGLALLLTFCAIRWGNLAAVIAAATLAVDFSVMQAAGTLATESLAILIFAITFLLLVRAWEHPTLGRWFIAGVSFAALMLTRGIWSLGLLILIATTTLCLIPAIRRRWESLRPTHLIAFLATAMLVAMPWWIRNCQETGHFTPFGTAGSCGFVAAYCDESFEDFGQWQPDVFNRNQIEVQKNVDMDTIKLADLEYMTGQESMRKTKAWCLANWNLIPQLMLCRGVSHWGFFNTSVSLPLQLANIWLIVVGIAGCFFGTGRIRSVFIAVLLLDSLLVMLTWEHLGRYAIPIRPVVHVGYGLAMAWVIRRIVVVASSRNPVDR